MTKADYDEQMETLEADRDRALSYRAFNEANEITQDIDALIECGWGDEECEPARDWYELGLFE